MNEELDKKHGEYLICTDDSVIQKGIPNFNKAVKEAERWRAFFDTLNIYICKVVVKANEI